MGVVQRLLGFCVPILVGIDGAAHSVFLIASAFCNYTMGVTGPLLSSATPQLNTEY
jgi:hypothetical protein